MSSQSDPDVPRIVYIGVLGVILTFVIIVALQVIFYRMEQTEIARKVARHGPEEVFRLQATQLEQLNNYRWVDRKTNTVAIPIERAMEIVAQEANMAVDSTTVQTNETE
jgi:hypothetical protein